MFDSAIRFSLIITLIGLIGRPVSTPDPISPVFGRRF
jgi:hypothetical protein